MRKDLNVCIDDAVYCYDPCTDDAFFLPFEYASFLHTIEGSDKHYWTTGAVFSAYGKLRKEEKVIKLMIEMVQSVIRDGVDAKAAIMALTQIDEIRELFAEDVLI